VCNNLDLSVEGVILLTAVIGADRRSVVRRRARVRPVRALI